MNHAINFEPFSQGNSFHAPQLISLPVNLVELREQNPAAYLECYLSLFRASGFDGDRFNLCLGSQLIEFDPVDFAGGFLKPNNKMLTVYTCNPTAKLRLEGFADPYSFDMAEPNLLDTSVFQYDAEIKFFRDHFTVVPNTIEKEIKDQINIILNKYNIL